MNKEPIRCCDGCGASAVDDSDATAKGWQRLQLTGRWRCAACALALAKVNQ